LNPARLPPISRFGRAAGASRRVVSGEIEVGTRERATMDLMYEIGSLNVLDGAYGWL
jgi:hypothetical protein